MSNPTRLYAGLSTAYTNEIFHSYPFPDPFHTGSTQALGSTNYINDFNTLVGTDYAVAGTSSTFALTNGVGGVAIITPGGATTATTVTKNGQAFQFQSGNRFWYTVRFQASGVGADSFYVGLQNGTSANDGIWFSKAASSSSINLVSVVGSTSTTLVTGLTTVTAATYVELGFYYNGTDLLVYAGNQLQTRITSPTIGSSATTLTNTTLSPVFEITPAATETMTVDFVGVAQEVTR